MTWSDPSMWFIGAGIIVVLIVNYIYKLKEDKK